jgi:hypothetical protein
MLCLSMPSIFWPLRSLLSCFTGEILVHTFLPVYNTSPCFSFPSLFPSCYLSTNLLLDSPWCPPMASHPLPRTTLLGTRQKIQKQTQPNIPSLLKLPQHSQLKINTSKPIRQQTALLSSSKTSPSAYWVKRVRVTDTSTWFSQEPIPRQLAGASLKSPRRL